MARRRSGRRKRREKMKFKGKIFLVRYPWNIISYWKLVILNINKFVRSDQFKSNPKLFNCSRANRLSGLIGEWLEKSSCPDNKA